MFGVYGGLLGFLMGHRDAIPKAALAGVGRSAAVFIGYNLVFSLAPGVDMAAHVGGLVVGGVLALALPNAVDGGSRGPRIVLTSLVGLAIVAAFVGRLPTDSVMMDIQEAAKIEEKALSRWNEVVQANSSGEMSDLDAARAIETEILPDWRVAHGLWKKAAEAREDNEQMQTLLEYAQARERGWELMLAGLQNNDPNQVEAGVAEQQRAEELVQKIQATEDQAQK